MHPNVHHNTVYKSQDMETTKGMDKENVVYTVEYYSAIKMNEITTFVATWMDLESVILSEVS